MTQQVESQNPDSQYHIDQTAHAKTLEMPYYQIKCDVCGHLSTAMTSGSSNFDFCDGHSGNFITVDGDDEPFELNCRDFVLDEATKDWTIPIYVSNYEVRELTGYHDGITEWSRFQKSGLVTLDGPPR